MSQRDTTIRTVQILLTITAFEFFGPIFRDFNASHAWNPDWDPHARLHLVWQLSTMAFSGIANLYLVWMRRPFDVRNLWLSVAWQLTTIGGFWSACLLTPVYGGRITMPNIHVYIFGMDENVLVFAILSMILLAAVVKLRSIPLGVAPR